MIRKLVLAFGATAVIAAAALTPTTASAWGGKHGHHGLWLGSVGLYSPTYVAAPDCYVVKRAFVRADGSVRVRYATVCD